MRADLPNGAGAFWPETYQKKLDDLGAKFNDALHATGVHPVAIAHLCLVAYLIGIRLAGHDDIADDLTKMFNETLKWPKEWRTKEQRRADAEKVKGVIDSVLGTQKADDAEALYLSLPILGQVVINVVAEFGGQKVADFVEEKMVAAGNWSVVKDAPTAPGELN